MKQDLSCTYLAHHELESIFVIIIIITVIIIIIIVIIIIIIIMKQARVSRQAEAVQGLLVTAPARMCA